ncbi:MAG: hypothetical protein NTY10_04885 [Candidatus Omnitrophica bacterium]|nr:hypothetical protein [Candidatus Omnitrophota bacterium]
MMTSKERLLAAMRREEVDKIPLAPRMTNVTLRYYRSTDLWAYQKFKKEYFDCDPTVVYELPVINPFAACIEPLDYLNDVDIALEYTDKKDHFLIKRTFRTPAGTISEKVILPKPGTIHYGANPNPHRVEHLVKSPEDLDKIRYLFPKLDGLNFSKYHHAVEEMGLDGLTQIYLPGPMDTMGGEACSTEQMMVDYYERPEFFDAILKIFAEYSVGLVKTALENGVRDFFLVYFYTSLSAGWSPKIITEKFYPIIKKQTEMIHSGGGLVDYYDDGRLMDSVDIFVKAGVDVIETCSPAPVGDFRLPEAKERWGNNVTFKGLIDMINVIALGTPADIDKHVQDIVTQNGDKRGMILGTMDGIRPETSDENIAAYFSAANKYR